MVASRTGKWLRRAALEPLLRLSRTPSTDLLDKIGLRKVHPQQTASRTYRCSGAAEIEVLGQERRPAKPTIGLEVKLNVAALKLPCDGARAATLGTSDDEKPCRLE